MDLRLASALIWVCALWLSGARASQAWAQAHPGSTNEAAARAATSRGEALFAVDNYEAALAEFEHAYSLLEGHPRRIILLSNLAACNERLFRYDQATRLYRRYLDEGGSEVQDRVEIEQRLRSLLALLGTLSVETNVPSELWVDNHRRAHTPSRVRVSPGKHSIELRAAHYESARREVVVAAGTSLSLRIELEALSRYSGVHRAYFWSFAGATLGALLGASAFAVAATNADRAGVERAQRDRFLNTTDDEAAVHRLTLSADILFAAAALLGVSSTVLYFVTDWRSAEQRTKKPANIAIRASATPGSLQVALGGAL